DRRAEHRGSKKFGLAVSDLRFDRAGLTALTRLVHPADRVGRLINPAYVEFRSRAPSEPMGRRSIGGRFFGNSDAGRSGEARLEEPADEFRLALGSGFRENVLRVPARRGLADLEPAATSMSPKRDRLMGWSNSTKRSRSSWPMMPGPRAVQVEGT